VGALVRMSGGSGLRILNCPASYSPRGTVDRTIYPISIQFLSADRSGKPSAGGITGAGGLHDHRSTLFVSVFVQAGQKAFVAARRPPCSTLLCLLKSMR
jgi:hypothetical protein